MATRLGLYNEAARLIGEQPLATVTDDVPIRYTLDESFDDVVLDGLSRGIWNFALKTATFTSDGSITPLPGYAFAIAKPDDWLATIAASEYRDIRDYYFSETSDQIKDSGGAWHSDSDELTVEYISTDFAEDANLGEWTPLFSRFIAASLALDIANRLTQSSTTVQVIEREVKNRLLRAKSRDARDEKEARVRPGNWIRAQRGYANRLNRQRTAVGGQLNTRQGNV